MNFYTTNDSTASANSTGSTFGTGYYAGDVILIRMFRRPSFAVELALLGLQRGCSRTEVVRAFRKLALKHHPDRGGDAEDFKTLVAAKDRLLGSGGAQ